ncbi:hypothetical protein W97_03791 [Coniosporium apollinis CBS 100218]|uniref:Cutinase n=1 Tax=Coniosporium apollinis (strain CBS 100218) TaxID=1168221 RepID=R7YRS6_CONA1|nr:uncharacterized protein W97_03791 [Coniosporium apollinis CBS 100218]EON64558.1 hypothetical protein W97_03791 [Coniosporium apollinis CBS 100218]
MWKQNLFSLVLATLASVSWAAPGDVCRSSLGSGTCKSTGSCPTGFTVRGACPNDPADIRCCIQTACKTNTGTCLDKSITPCRGGRFEAGHCPGSTNIQCCIRDTAPTPTPTPKCPTSWVIGVRGSGESLTGANEIEKMRATVSAYVREAAAALPTDTEYLSLRYAAAPVGPDHLTSQQAGAELLRTVIRACVSACPNIRIGVMGYSQGAHVVNDALSYLSRNTPSALERVRAGYYRLRTPGPILRSLIIWVLR